MTYLKSNRFPLLSLFVIVIIIFREYFTGAKSPSWDFLTDYFTASFVWWTSGSFFNPPSYLPYAFSGFPAHLSGQAANWYLPVGLVAELGIYNIHTSAILQAFTILFGIFGLYFLAKAWGISNNVSLLLAIGYLFSPGFFTSASHIDIVRGWAFMPWILLALKPKANVSKTLMFLIVLLSFQFMVGVYPGIIIASIYILGVYILLNLYFDKKVRKRYLIYQLLPFLLGVLMSFLKWLPLVTEERLYRGGNTVEVTSAIISTLVYPYDTLVLPNDITMRSFFLAPLLLVSIFLLQKINRQVVTFGFILVVALLLGFDISETNRWQENLPFLSESRFRTTDFKLFWIMSAIMLGGAALEQAKERGVSVLRGAFALGLAFLSFIYLNRLAKTALLEDMLTPGNTFARTAGIGFAFMILLFVLRRSINIGSNLAVTLAILVSIFIGYSWTEVNKTPWSNDRQGIEQVYYGMSLDNRIAEGLNKVTELRPARMGPEFPIPYPIELTSQKWSTSEINKTFSLGGYVPLKGIPRYEWMIEFAKTPESIPFYSLLAQAQTGWVVTESNSDLKAVNCIYETTCLVENARVSAKSWDLNRLEYQIETPAPGLLVLNEIPWQGWKASICSSGSCSEQLVNSNLENVLIGVPIDSQTTTVVLEYFQPYRTITWIIFWVSLAALALLMTLNKRNSKKLIR